MYFPSSELTNFSSSSVLSTLTPMQEHGPDHGVDADQAERDARELTAAFQHALSNNNTNVDNDAMDVDSDTYNCEGEDEGDEDGDEVVLVDPQVQSAKEWVCVRTYGIFQPYTTSTR
jgi:hypothetical protein